MQNSELEMNKSSKGRQLEVSVGVWCLIKGSQAQRDTE